MFLLLTSLRISEFDYYIEKKVLHVGSMLGPITGLVVHVQYCHAEHDKRFVWVLGQLFAN